MVKKKKHFHESIHVSKYALISLSSSIISLLANTKGIAIPATSSTCSFVQCQPALFTVTMCDQLCCSCSAGFFIHLPLLSTTPFLHPLTHSITPFLHPYPFYHTISSSITILSITPFLHPLNHSITIYPSIYPLYVSHHFFIHTSIYHTISSSITSLSITPFLHPLHILPITFLHPLPILSITPFLHPFTNSITPFLHPFTNSIYIAISSSIPLLPITPFLPPFTPSLYHTGNIFSYTASPLCQLTFTEIVLQEL